jgi:hypothetical protein
MNALDATLDAATRRAWLADAHAQEALERAAALAARCERLRQEITFAQIRYKLGLSEADRSLRAKPLTDMGTLSR